MKNLIFLSFVLSVIFSCSNDLIVETVSVSSISCSSAHIEYKVESSNKGMVISRGLCWSKEPSPNFQDNHVNLGSGSGNYKYTIKDLKPNETYYVKAYAQISNKIKFGNELVFSTIESKIPEIETLDILNIKQYSAICESKIISNSGGEIIKKGICWDTDKEPTINNNILISHVPSDKFKIKIDNLKKGTKYYVRAFASNEVGTGYGDVIGFTTIILAEPVEVFFKELGKIILYMHPDTSIVLATTNTFKIMNYDIMENVYQGMRGDISILSNIEPARIESFLISVITLKAQQDIILEEAKKEGLTVSKDSIEAFIEKNLFEPNGGKEAFLEQLKLQHIDLDYVREDTRKNMLIAKYIDEVAFKDVDVNIADDEIKAFYENKAEYSQETATVRHILFLTQGKSDTEKSNIKKSAEEVLKRAKAGEDFVKLVEQYSEDPGSNKTGGLYADLTRGRMNKAFEDASFNLPVGTISNLVEESYGYHIIKIEDQKKIRKLSEVRENIIKELKEEKKEDMFPEFLNSLVNEYNFKIII